MPANNGDLERRLWDAADELRANSKLKASEYSVPVLGLIFLKFADDRFAAVRKELEAEAAQSQRRRTVSKTDYLARCVYLPDNARFQTLLDLPKGESVARAINDAMKAVEDENPDLRGVLPKTYTRLSDANLVELLRIMNSIPADIEGDAFGKIYEYFLGKFAMSEGQKGGEFFTPTAVVKLSVEILEPFHGKILDPASWTRPPVRPACSSSRLGSCRSTSRNRTPRFLDRAKATDRKHPNRDHVLFLDARHIYRQLDRAHRDFTPQQIEFLANTDEQHQQKCEWAYHHVYESYFGAGKSIYAAA